MRAPKVKGCLFHARTSSGTFELQCGVKKGLRRLQVALKKSSRARQTEMQNKYLVADARDPDAVKQISRAITAWDPLLSVRVAIGESLYGGVLSSYCLCIGDQTTLSFRERRALVDRGDAIVLAPSVRVAAQPASEFLCIGYEGLAPEHLRGPAGLALGFEHFSFGRAIADRSICGNRRQVLPSDDLRHRVQYHFVEIDSAEPHTHADMVKLYYVLSGDGEVRIGPAEGQLSGVPIHVGQLLVVGPGLFHIPSNGLGMCVWFLCSEMAHRRRLREAAV
jgi:mannose-6-phosphate isomerase-like protein (cupin superfamily)